MSWWEWIVLFGLAVAAGLYWIVMTVLAWIPVAIAWSLVSPTRPLLPLAAGLAFIAISKIRRST